jgi:hypothetical protein
MPLKANATMNKCLYEKMSFRTNAIMKKCDYEKMPLRKIPL